MRRREIIKGVVSSAVAWPLAARAQQSATRVIGYLDSRSPEAVETGIDIFTGELVAKRLEVLRDLLPHAARMGVLINPADAGATDAQLKEIDAAARAMGLQIQVHYADTRAEIDAAFEAMGRDRPDAVFAGTTAFLNGRRVQLAQLAAFYRLPAIYPLRDFVQVGGLISYGSDIIDAFRQAGGHVGRVIKGAKPAELPIVKAAKFELVINAQTARMLGLTVRSSLLGRADEIID